MGNMSNHQVLRRLLRQTEPEPEHLGPARVLGLAMGRAADRGLGLSLTVTGVQDQRLGLDGLVDSLGGELMLLALSRGGSQIGILALDAEFRSAVVEMVTLGRLRDAAASARAVSPGDVAICLPFGERFLAEVAMASEGTSLAGWADGFDVDSRLPDARTVGLSYAEVAYRLARFSLDLGVAGRRGSLILALPADPPKTGHDRTVGPTGAGFNDTLQDAVLEAPALLHAVLHRLPMSIRQAGALTVGQTIPLPGITTRSVRIEGPDGTMLGPARLGQVSGLRAVRLEWVPPPEMSEVRLGAGSLAPVGQEPVSPASIEAGSVGQESPMEGGFPGQTDPDDLMAGMGGQQELEGPGEGLGIEDPEHHAPSDGQDMAHDDPDDPDPDWPAMALPTLPATPDLS